MINEFQLHIKDYQFNKDIFNQLSDNHYAKELWPIVYIISDAKKKEAYIGETIDANARMNSHLKNSQKNRLSSVHLIASEKFNKSATLDIESNLIKYMSADGKFKLLNGNLGLANHNFFQKQELYWKIFQNIWQQLRREGLTEHSLEHIDNSDLFKYSPYKSLTKDQINSLLSIFNSLLDNNLNNIIVEGGAGTGKTILAIFIFKLRPLLD